MIPLITLKHGSVMTMMTKIMHSKPEQFHSFVTYPGDSTKIDVVPGSMIEGLVCVCRLLAATMTRL